MAGRFSALGDILTSMKQHPTRVSAFLATLDDATAARLMAAAEAGDTRALLKAMAEQTFPTAPARQTPEVQVRPAGPRGPMSLEDRLAGEPKIRAGVEDAGIPTVGMSQGDMLAAYADAFKRSGAQRGGPKSTVDSIRELAKPADQVAAESIAGQFDAAAYNPRPDNPQARSRALNAARESYPADYDMDAEDLMAPDLLDGLTPQYRRLLQELEKNEWLGFDYPSQAVSSVLEYGDAPRRWDMTPALLEARDAMIFARGPSRAAAPPSPTRQMELPMGDGPTVPDRPYRVVDEAQPVRGGRTAAAAAGAAALGGAAYWASQQGGGEVTSGGEADLVEESRPAPQVAATPTTPTPTVVQAPADYSLQARELINRLNDMRRAAGGEVPEAPAMMQEINRLVAMGNEQRRSPQYSHPQADPARDPYQQARSLIAQVNQMYQQGHSPNSPQVQRLMAQVRQLQAQGDAIRNRRAG